MKIDINKYKDVYYDVAFGSIIKYVPHATVITTYDYNNPQMLYCNHKHTELTKYFMDELFGKNPNMFKCETTNFNQSLLLKESLKKHDTYHGVLVNRNKYNELYSMTLSIFGIVVPDKDNPEHNERFYIALKVKNNSS